MARHILELRAALEFATFRSPDIRDAVVNCIKVMDKEMEEVEYTHSIEAVNAFKELNACISEYENEVAPEVNSSTDDDADDELATEVTIVEEIEIEIERAIGPSDDDDDDIPID